jgi:hypothetical protein
MRLLSIATSIFLGLSAAAQAGSLFLLVDMSNSIDGLGMRYQMESYANVLPFVAGLGNYDIHVMAFSGGYDHPVRGGTVQEATAYFEDWAGIRPVGPAGGTCLHGVLQRIIDIYHTLPQPVVIDITGDGTHNCVEPIWRSYRGHATYLLNTLEEMGAQVNVLYIGDGLPHEVGYTEFSSMRRGGGFAMLATNLYDFELALFDKLTLEVAHLNETQTDTNMD